MEQILLKNARVWSAGRTAAADVLVEGDSIAAVSPALSAPGAREVDLNGFTLMPGFFNAHVHLYGVRGPLPDELIAGWVKHGVTCVRDMGMTSTAPFSDYLAWAGKHTGTDYPMILNSGKFLCCKHTYGEIHPSGACIGQVMDDDPASAERAVDAMLDAGAGEIKTGYDLGQDPAHPLDYISEPTFRAMCRRAKERGSRTAAHITSAANLAKAVQWGLSEGAHCPIDVMSQEDEKIIASSGASFTATLSIFDFVSSQTGEKIMDNAIENAGRLYRAGVPMAVGTDFMFEAPPYEEAGVPIHEFQLLRRAGLSVDEILTAATEGSARVCGVADRLGTVAPGKLACLAAFRGTVGDSFEALRNIPFVMNRGVIVTAS